MITILGLILLIATAWVIVKSVKADEWKEVSEAFPDQWRKYLEDKVVFYRALSQDEKSRFEKNIQEFIANYNIIGIDVDVTDEDRLLVASSAVIPVFGFPNWRYPNLKIIQLYPDMFNQDFATEGKGRRILGMVGSGFMDGKMILSKPALQYGFANESDKKNTAIHEFVHLIDKSDAIIDGVPNALLEKQYSIPWLDLINKEIKAIYKNKSDINPYGATNNAEFFAVASEYFFERPQLLARKHPELYAILEKAFRQNMKKRSLKKFW